jgi:Arabinose efflux permease
MSTPLAVPSAGTISKDGSYQWRWIALFVILAAEVMDLLDALVTNIAAPTIRIELGGTASLMQWLGAGYTLAMAVGLITGGRLGDIFGKRRMFLIGAIGFGSGSLLCALAQSPEILIAARVLQGLFGAVMLPQGLGMIKEMFDRTEMAKAFGLFGPVMGLSSVGGPVLAGWLIEADFFGTGWRMIFLINLPLSLIAILGGVRFLPKIRSPHPLRLDMVGMGLISMAAFLIVYPLVQGRELDWPIWMFAMMAGAVVVLTVFGRYEAHKQRLGGDPLVVPGLFRKRAFSGGLIMGLVFFSGMTGFSLVFSLYTQIGLGYPPLKAGLAGLPWSIGMLVGFGIAQGFVQRLGRRLIHIGTVIMAAGVAGMVLTLDIAGIGVTPWQLAPTLIVTGIGMGLIMSPYFDIVLAGVEPHETGSASGTLTAVQQLGSAFGVALLGTVFFGLLGANVTAAADDTVPKLRAELATVQVTGAQQDALVTGLRDCSHDRAVAKDQSAIPVSCARLASDARAAATSPESGAAIQRALATSGETAAKAGFSDAMKLTVWVVVGMLTLTFVVTYLMPKRAREEDETAGP